MPRLLPRVRGALLRLVRRRRLSIVIGLLLAAPSAWIELSPKVGSWWVDGMALVVGATGLALLWTGITGPGPDWTEVDE
jgi:hypothetical protein